MGTNPSMDWKKRVDIFEVALLAKHSISLTELTRDTPPEREKELMGNGTAETASKKLISVMFLALGDAARKTLTDLHPNMRLAEVTLTEFFQYCNMAFDKRCNRTLDRFKFFSRK